MEKREKEVVLCSVYLLGIGCGYDGKSNLNKKVVGLSKKMVPIPVWPEILGGLPTPREPAEQRGKKVFTKSGKDVTSSFKRGAKEVLKIAKLFDVKKAILKQRSPSCGYGRIYDRSFSGKVIQGNGVTTSLLEKNGIEVITEKDL